MLLHASFHHIGYAVVSIETTAQYYVEWGYLLGETVVDEIQKVKVAFLTKEGFPTVELVEGLNEHAPTVKILEKSGVSPYHVCYEVADIHQAIRELKSKQFIPIFKPVGAAAFAGRLICYLYNKDVGLVELLNK